MSKKRLQRMTSSIDHKENAFAKSKERATNPLETVFTKATWDVDNENTQRILQDMGVDYLSQSTDSCNSENTPALSMFGKEDNSQSSCASFYLPPVPGAPRILLDSQRDNVTSGSDESSENDFCHDLTPSLRPMHMYPHTHVQFIINKPSKRQNADLCAFDHFSILSDEMILCIFSWLPKFVLAKCGCVCKRWSRLVLDESLWKRIDLSAKALRAGVLGNVLNRGVWALRLAKAEVKYEQSPLTQLETMRNSSTKLSKLQYLDLSMAGTTPDVLEEVFSICKDLRKVSLENVTVNNKVCSYIGENRCLEMLNMAMCEGITSSGLRPILSNCRRLESLNMAWTSLHRHSIVYLCLCLPPSLLKLNISGCRENITDEEVLQLCKKCSNLREVDLSDSTSLSGDSITHIIQNLAYLEHLALSRCYHITPAAILELNQMPSLLAVDVFGMLREGPLEILKANMPHIEVNQFPFSSIARPTTGIRRTSIWNIRVRDNAI